MLTELLNAYVGDWLHMLTPWSLRHGFADSAFDDHKLILHQFVVSFETCRQFTYVNELS